MCGNAKSLVHIQFMRLSRAESFDDSWILAARPESLRAISIKSLAGVVASAPGRDIRHHAGNGDSTYPMNGIDLDSER